MTTTAYMLDNAWRDARRRLELLEQCFDPGTLRRLAGLGVGRGQHCLEVAGGAGSVTRWLCSRVGSEGSVTAIDLDTRFLEEIEAPHLTVRRCDVVRDALPAGPFDLIHVRAQLMHLHEREEVLDRLVERLRPGGWLLAEEPDVYPFEALECGSLDRAWKALGEAAAPYGFRTDLGRRLPELLAQRGLVDLRSEADGSFFPGGSPLATMLGMSIRQIVEQVELAEPGQADVVRSLAELEDPVRWFPGPALVAAMGRRPPTTGDTNPVDPYPDLLVP
jgi:SAM-dependent methyltransferase